MSATATFVLPSLFEQHCYHFLDDHGQASMKQLSALLARSKKQPIGSLNEWICSHYQLPSDYSNSAKLMAEAAGLTTLDINKNSYWLRADPVMLTATHNGILCRGNRSLNLSKEERVSVESLVNDYLRDQSIELFLPTNCQGYVKFTEQTNCVFTPLSETIGQDITHRLPAGDNEAYWHRLLIDLQMLLHNCAVNQQRSAKGQTEISGLWLWAETDLQSQDKPEHNQTLFTDDFAIAGALGQTPNLEDLPARFDLEYCNGDFSVYVADFQEAFLQNEMESWSSLFETWVNQWLLPALTSVSNGKLQAVNLIPGDGYCYQYNANSRWCFWRHHSFLDENNQ